MTCDNGDVLSSSNPTQKNKAAVEFWVFILMSNLTI